MIIQFDLSEYYSQEKRISKEIFNISTGNYRLKTSIQLGKTSFSDQRSSITLSLGKWCFLHFFDVYSTEIISNIKSTTSSSSRTFDYAWETSSSITLKSIIHREISHRLIIVRSSMSTEEFLYLIFDLKKTIRNRLEFKTHFFLFRLTSVHRS